MRHANAPLTPTGRYRLAQLIVNDGWSCARAAERFQVSPSTAHKWSRRYRDGLPMTDRSSRPATNPNQTPLRREHRIINLRHTRRWGPARIAYHLGLAPSTVDRVLRRYHMPALAMVDWATGLPVRRPAPRSYVYSSPGEMVHMDIKKLGRILDGGGWRKLGRGKDKTKGHAGVGYEYLHHVVDDCSRLAYLEILGDEKKETVTGFWGRARDFFADYGISIERVMTEDGAAYRSRLLREVPAAQQVKHVFTRPTGRRPMARSSVSTGRWRLSGRMRKPTTVKPPVRRGIRGGCITTIITDPTVHWAVELPRTLFATSRDITPSQGISGPTRSRRAGGFASIWAPGSGVIYQGLQISSARMLGMLCGRSYTHGPSVSVPTAVRMTYPTVQALPLNKSSATSLNHGLDLFGAARVQNSHFVKPHSHA